MLAGFRDVDLSTFAWASLDLTGSETGDKVDLHSVRRHGPITASLGSGRDHTTLSGSQQGTVDLGSGRDAASVPGASSRHPRGRFGMGLGRTWRLGRTKGTRLMSAEVVSVKHFVSVSTAGSSGADVRRVAACGAVVDGGPGSDLVNLSAARSCRHIGSFATFGGGRSDRTRRHPVVRPLVGGP